MTISKGNERVRARYRGNYGRLAQIKAACDPPQPPPRQPEHPAEGAAHVQDNIHQRRQSNLTPVRRPTVMVYAGLAYAAFAAAALWAIAFLADLSTPHAVDGASRRPAWTALLIDACLLLVFAVQHSVMARAGSKQRLARILPAATERSTYVLAASLALGLLFWQWQPLPASAWHVSAQPWAALIWVVYAAGWLLVVATTFMIDHLDFLGLRRVPC